MEDEKILDLFFQRSEQAIDALSDKYGKRLRALADNLLGDGRDAEECVSDTLLALWNRIPPERPSPLLTYASRVLRNLALKRYHHNTAQKRNSFYDVALGELCDSLSAGDVTAQAVDLQILTGAINGFLEGLSKDDRILFVRRYWYADPLPVLADKRGLTQHAVSVRLFRMREKLKNHLRKEGIAL